jgi:exo-1,4-beta-D-glucosaminidase
LVPLCAVITLAPSAASADVTDLGGAGWQVQSSAQATQSGATISDPGFDAASWLSVRNDDGGAPGTEIEALVQNGACPNVYVSTNLKGCFGYMDAVGPDTVARFAVPWWYRTTFHGDPGSDRHASLVVNGVVGQADVYLNGHEVATQATVEGAYTQYSFDVTRWLRPGANAVALRMYPNDPSTMFTLDNVDWTQIPPDNNTGIQFPVQLHTSGAVALTDAHVVQDDTPGVTKSALTLKAHVANLSATRRTARLRATVTAPGGGSIAVFKSVTLAAGASQDVALTPAAYPQLTIDHPRVWWPYRMGAQPLYRLSMSVGRADSSSQTFGIRSITTRLIGASPLAPQGSRQFLVNGVPFTFRAGGWSEDLLLHYSSADTANQIGMIKNLGLNGIRTEGKQMPTDFYEQMDRAGILIDAGYQCCDAWQLQDDQFPITAHDYQVLELSALTIGRQLRNHPSILNFSWSDNNPTPQQESVSLQGFSAADFPDPLIASAEYKSTAQLGPSGEKEGPYDWVPPSYWYDTSHYDPGDDSRTNVGGAWAFDSEASAGDTVPTLDSLHRFLSPFEQTQLWQSPDYNQYHLNYEPGLPSSDNGGYSFGTLHDLDQAISARYGPWTSLDQYVEEAQLQNYETQRAEFEAYIAHSQNAQAPSTGIVYWQLNKGWPTLLWDLYNNDYDQAGSYFGAQEANQSLHAFYAYDSHPPAQVGIANLTGHRVGGLSVRARVYGVGGALLSKSQSPAVALDGQGVAGDVLEPTVPAPTTPPAAARTYFVELQLTRGGHVVDRNVYWLSTQPDQVDWSKTIGQPQATMTSYADLRQLRQLPAAQVSVSASSHPERGARGTDRVAVVRITNTSSQPTAAFFLRADLRRGSAAGVPAAGDNELLPVFWDRNDTTLWPGESETLHVGYRSAQLDGASPVVSVSGDNVAETDVPAG